MNIEMLFKISLIFVGLAALVTIEWFLPSVLPHVPLQRRRLSASVAALVTLERLFYGVFCQHVTFQMARLNA